MNTRLETDARNACTEFGSIVNPAFKELHRFSMATSRNLWNASIAASSFLKTSDNSVQKKYVYFM